MNVPTFVVCGTMASNERSRRHREPLTTRLLSANMLLYIAYIAYAVVPLYFYLRNVAVNQRVFPSPGPWVKLASCISKVFVPVIYMIRPPEMPERAALMEDNEKGVHMPRKECKKSEGREWASWAVVTVLELAVLLWAL